MCFFLIQYFLNRRSLWLKGKFSSFLRPLNIYSLNEKYFICIRNKVLGINSYENVFIELYVHIFFKRQTEYFQIRVIYNFNIYSLLRVSPLQKNYTYKTLNQYEFLGYIIQVA